MEAEQDDTAGDSPARLLLIDQRRLVHEQIGLARNERFRARIKAHRDAALTLFALAVVAGLGWFVWSASRADGLVLEPFNVPPQMAEAGFTGEVAAGALRDRIRVMQAGAEVASPFAAAKAEDAGSDVNFEIPQTGVSMGDLERYLKRRLGRQTVVQGDVVRLPDRRLAVTVRAGREPGATFQGHEAEAPALMQQAAEHVLRSAQPLNYASWTSSRAFREDDPARAAAEFEAAGRVLEPMTQTGAPKDRAMAMAMLANIRGFQERMDEARALLYATVQLDPENIISRATLANLEHQSGRWEMSRHHSLLAARECRREAQRRLMTESAREFCLPAVSAQAQFNDADFAEMVAGAHRLAEANRRDGLVREASQALIDVPEMLIRQHEFGAAQRALLDLPDDLGATVALRIRAYQLLRAREQGDAAAALIAARAFRASGRAPLRLMIDIPESVSVEAEMGDPRVALALVRDTPLDCLPCVLVRARTAWAMNNPAGAGRWYDHAVRIAPSLPGPYSARGQWRAVRGDTEGAIADFRAAQERGPRWAEPFKFEGDILMRQGKPRDAERRYRLAAERAPHWGALHLARGEALNALRRSEQAREQWRAARDLVLTPGERATVIRRLGGVAPAAG